MCGRCLSRLTDLLQEPLDSAVAVP